MAQKVTVALEDDLDGGPADETVRFGLGGADYEIDLSAKNARAFRKQLTPLIEHAPQSEPRAGAPDGADFGRPARPPPTDVEHGRGRRLPRARIKYPITERERTRTRRSRVPPILLCLLSASPSAVVGCRSA